MWFLFFAIGVGALTFVCAPAMWLADRSFLKYLRVNHKRKWIELGSPKSYHSNVYFCEDTKRVRKFLSCGEYMLLNDSFLNSRCFLSILFSSLFKLVFTVIVVGILIFAYNQ